MWNSGNSIGKPDHILILALNSGAGHRVRMESLAAVLRQREIPVVIHLLDAPVEPVSAEAFYAAARSRAESLLREDQGVKLIVLDARDLDPGICTVAGRVIAVDNLHASRWQPEREGAVLFFDTLPHPRLDETFEGITRSILLDQDVLDRARHPRRTALPGRSRLTFYAGPESFLPLTVIEAVDGWLSGADSILYTRVGGPRRSGIYSIPYLTRSRYLDLLVNTDIFLTYPGMSYWESLLLGATGVLLATGSEVHDRLAEYLSRKMGSVLLRPDDLKGILPGEMILDALTRSLSFDLERWRADALERPGLERLARAVEELWNEFRKEQNR